MGFHTPFHEAPLMYRTGDGPECAILAP